MMMCTCPLFSFSARQIYWLLPRNPLSVTLLFVKWYPSIACNWFQLVLSACHLVVAYSSYHYSHKTHATNVHSCIYHIDGKLSYRDNLISIAYRSLDVPTSDLCYVIIYVYERVINGIYLSKVRANVARVSPAHLLNIVDKCRQPADINYYINHRWWYLNDFQVQNSVIVVCKQAAYSRCVSVS